LPGQCFAGHEKSDLLWRGRKIAGAAQRRNRLGLLIQGSVQPPPVSLVREDWEAAMAQVARQQFQVKWEMFPGDTALQRHADELRSEKFAQACFNQKR